MMKYKYLIIVTLFFYSCSESSQRSQGSDLQKMTAVNGQIDSVQQFIDQLVNIRNKEGQLSQRELNHYAGSLVDQMKLDNRNLKFVYDDSYLPESFYKYNNEIAHKALAESSWKDEVSSDDFKEYVLPYKLDYELVDAWRAILYHQHQDLKISNPSCTNLDSLVKYYKTTPNPSLMGRLRFNSPLVGNYTVLNTFSRKDCIDRCRYLIYFLRAAGVPATFDYLPSWGNKTFAYHTEVGLANKSCQLSKLSSNINRPSRICQDFNLSIDPEKLHLFKEAELPEGIYVQYAKTIPKVYRQTWTAQRKPSEIRLNSSKDEIDNALIKPNMRDVTDEYIETMPVTVRRKYLDDATVLYLSTFSVNGWRSVAYSTFSRGRAIFDKMGTNILYLPCKMQGKLLPYSYPFVLDTLGQKQIYKCNNKTTVNMRLRRKYPLFAYSADHSLNFMGATIQAYNDDNKGRKELASISHFPFGPQEIEISDTNSFRYVRIGGAKRNRIDVAEFECYTDSCGIEVRLKDYYYDERHPSRPNIHDGDLNTSHRERVMALDFKEPKVITKIKYCPRSDTNFIIKGNIYELFYWDKQWVSAGKQIASKYCLDYKKIPSGTIYWLRCLSGGKEERVFTYENDTQVWW